MASTAETQNFIIYCVHFISYPFILILNKIFSEIHILEQFYIKLYNIYALVSQMFFFLSCALLFNEMKGTNKNEEFVLIGLKTLLFYSVFTYFVTKTRDILSSDRPSIIRSWNMTEGVLRIVIEWCKAVVVVVCLREQGIYFKPSTPYALLTFSYYLSTERIFSDIFIKIIQTFAFDVFDDLEHLYVPLILNLYTVILSAFVGSYVIVSSDFLIFALMGFYFTVYIHLKDSYYNYWNVIERSQQTFENFRNASVRELEEFDDICAVCLNKMSRAKITPCNHFFHPQCLKEWIKNSLMCPLCKMNF